MCRTGAGHVLDDSDGDRMLGLDDCEKDPPSNEVFWLAHSGWKVVRNAGFEGWGCSGTPAGYFWSGEACVGTRMAWGRSSEET